MGDCGRIVPSDDELEAAWAAQAGLPDHLRDVAFPYGAVCDAMAVCRRIADRLEIDLGVRVGMVESLHEWTGGYRDEFDEEWCGAQSRDTSGAEPTPGSLAGRLTQLKEDLRSFEGACDEAWVAADDMNASREAAREQADFDPRDSDPYSGR